ncbi:uncharacterized protein LOC114260796 [Camellia sinensis]|uniref:uncharacterized protein LOC114260796 n=1 Tax=Camellia sinensis TaxID=4442 RepID=UPI0010360C7D|nr:uncharacterized protein LOC114260796 [Camellia sinensis]
MWLENRAFKAFFKEWWENARVHGWEGFKFMRRLRGVKENLKIWKREVFGDTGEMKAELVREIGELDVKEAREGLSQTLRFYRRVALGKRKKSFIKNLEVASGEVVCKEELIVKEIFNSYSNLYSDGGVDRPGIKGINWVPVDLASASWLERLFDEDEVRQAVFEYERDKAPGPDVADVLGRIIDLAKDKGVIEGFVVGRDGIVATHLQFADDTIFLSLKEESKVGSLLKILRIFEIVSGLKVNLSKSSVVGINLADSHVHRVAAMLGCSIDSFPLKYLGLPLGGDPRLVSFWELVLVKIRKRLEGWKRALLSKGGRYTLVQSILGSVPIYFLSLFKVPVSIARKIEKLMRDFLWEGCEEGKGVHLVRWETVSLSRAKGGLAIENIVARNIAFLGKWLWRFPLESESLWCSVIKSKYGVQSNGRDSNVVNRGNCRSPWKSISRLYPLVSNFLSFKVGNGKSYLFLGGCLVEGYVCLMELFLFFIGWFVLGMFQ